MKRLLADPVQFGGYYLFICCVLTCIITVIRSQMNVEGRETNQIQTTIMYIIV